MTAARKSSSAISTLQSPAMPPSIRPSCATSHLHRFAPAVPALQLCLGATFEVQNYAKLSWREDIAHMWSQATKVHLQ